MIFLLHYCISTSTLPFVLSILIISIYVFITYTYLLLSCIRSSQLHYIKPCIEEWKSAYNSCRQYEVKLSKIWIGNSQLTHGHLMSEMNHQNLQKCSMWKINTNNKTLPTRLPPMEGQQKEIQYPE